MISELDFKLYDKFDTTFIDLNSLEEELQENPFGKVILYIEEQRIIAYLYYSEIYERVEINNIEVEKEFRNKGIGTKLLAYLVSVANNKSISLEVKKDNYNAIKLYKKFNFEEKAIRKGYYHGIDGILMVRK